MRQRIFIFAASVSLVLFAMSLSFWVRSSMVCDRLHFATGDPASPSKAPASLIVVRQLDASIPWHLFHSYDIESADGSVCFGSIYMLSSQTTSPWPGGRWDQQHLPVLAPQCRGSLGFGVGIQGARLSKAVMIPYWALIVVTAPLPIMWAQRSARERRERQTGHCPVCGYDLRATPDRCPECGTLAGEAAPAAEQGLK